MAKNGSGIVSVRCLGDSVTERLPLSQVVILGTWDQVSSLVLAPPLKGRRLASSLSSPVGSHL